MLSKGRVEKHRKMIRQVRKDSPDDFWIGYEKALTWVVDHWKYNSCPLKRNICTKKDDMTCSHHYKCQTCGCHHTRGSNETEDKPNTWEK